ncbi:MAG: thioredoxin family protein [bacterium]
MLALFAIMHLHAFEMEKLPIQSSTYDKKRNPHMDLALSMEKAKKSGKKILMMVGGEWCRWCGQLDNFLDDHETVAKEFYTSFEVFRVYYGKDISKEGKSLLVQFPTFKGTPHFYLLDSKAKLLKSIDTRQFERGYSYDKKKFMSFIKKYR